MPHLSQWKPQLLNFLSQLASLPGIRSEKTPRVLFLFLILPWAAEKFTLALVWPGASRGPKVTELVKYSV